MSKSMKVFGVVLIVGLVALAGAAVALAQPLAPTRTPGGYGPGMMGGGYGGGMMGDGAGIMAEYQDLMHIPLAKALGMTLDEFNTALAAGQTPYTLAQTKGVDIATLQAAMTTGMSEAFKQAVKDGKLTQTQADTMLARHAQMQARQGTGGMGGRGRMGGGQFGAGGANGNCPYHPAPVATPAPTN